MTHTKTTAERTLSEFRNDRQMAEIIVARSAVAVWAHSPVSRFTPAQLLAGLTVPATA